jgi:hypothetical protein
MKRLPDVLLRKMCYIFHRGFVEARLLALQKKDEQAHDLADAFEVVPGCLPDWNEESLALVRSYLEPYEKKYGPLAFDYLSILDMDDASFMEMFGNY